MNRKKSTGKCKDNDQHHALYKQRKTSRFIKEKSKGYFDY